MISSVRCAWESEEQARSHETLLRALKFKTEPQDDCKDGILTLSANILFCYRINNSKYREIRTMLDFSKIPITIPDGLGYCPETKYANNKMFGSIELRSP